MEKIIDRNEFCKNVIGQKLALDEIYNIITWFKNSKELSKRGVSIPRGILLHGNPGDGKTLIMKEIVDSINVPTFTISGSNSNVVEEVQQTFKKARKEEQAIVLIDEIDLLINKEKRVIRVLQENLDGVESKDNVLVIAATNYLNEIPYPLTRNGRLEKIIGINELDGYDIIELYKKYFEMYGTKMPSDIDEEELILSSEGLSCAGLKAVVNDVLLRNGFDNITYEMIDQSVHYIVDGVNENESKTYNLDVAIHEAGHAVAANNFKEYFVINRLNLNSQSSSCVTKSVEPNIGTYDSFKAKIIVAMSGIVAQKVICKEGSVGCAEDLQEARRLAYHLINMAGYSSCYETLPVVDMKSRMETFIKRRKMECKIERFLKKCEKNSYKIIRKNKDKVIKLANALYEKKRLKSNEILALIN